MTKAQCLKVTVLCLCVATVSAPAMSSTYYVDQHHPRASDANPGAEDQPFKTISAAAGMLAPGDTVYIKAGVYREAVIAGTLSGTAEKPITFAAY